MFSACGITMGLSELTVEQWKERLALRFQQTEELKAAMIRDAERKGGLAELINDIKVGWREHLTTAMRKFLKAVAEFDHELFGEYKPSDNTLEYVASLGWVKTNFGDLWRTQSKNLLLQDYLESQRFLGERTEHIQGDLTGEKELVLTLYDERISSVTELDRKAILASSDPVYAELELVASRARPVTVTPLRAPIFAYVPGPLRIHGVLFGDSETVTVHGVEILLERSLADTNAHYFNGAMDEQRMSALTEILAMESTDDFNKYVVGEIAARCLQEKMSTPNGN